MQIKELLKECSSVWTQKNGVSGRLFTGPNGNSIFLPAAGDCNEATRYFAGSYGDYWSSVPNGRHPKCAYYLYFNRGGAGWGSGIRTRGKSVREVRKP